MFKLSHIMTIFRGVICRGSCFHSGSKCSICGLHQGLFDVTSFLPVRLVLFSMYIGCSQPPILASVHSIIHRSCYYSALGVQLSRHTWQEIRPCWRTWQYPKLQHGLPSLMQILTVQVISLELFQGVPQIASASHVYKFLHHSSRYCIALNLIFPAYTLSPTFYNFRSLLLQMEPTPSQVRNSYSQKSHEAHLERALAFQNAANLYCLSNVCLPSFSLYAL